jgi:hypothetical protein
MHEHAEALINSIIRLAADCWAFTAIAREDRMRFQSSLAIVSPGRNT